ncbi:hypothetical protein C8F04DRAFT_1269335 [Mycena alexandri]|uniref:Uncharacterized protein n=1 Tax=Mycena alexandri TaxID=1745969 RepID=A0AAD6SE43_9AGAR|nr:hypothetical protein C8F04DRAFT_1269335 [Mycena alexandri]
MSAAAATVLVGAPGPTNEAVADDSMPALIACTEADDDTTPDSISEEGWLKKNHVSDDARVRFLFSFDVCSLGIEKLSVDACFRLPQSALVSASTQERVASPAADLQRGERFANLDYSLLQQAPALQHVNIAYDIACQVRCDCRCHKTPKSKL